MKLEAFRRYNLRTKKKIMMKRILLGAALLIAAFATAFEVEASTPALPVMRLDSTITKDRGEDLYEKTEYFYEDSAQPAYEKKFD